LQLSLSGNPSVQRFFSKPPQLHLSDALHSLLLTQHVPFMDLTFGNISAPASIPADGENFAQSLHFMAKPSAMKI